MTGSYCVSLPADDIQHILLVEVVQQLERVSPANENGLRTPSKVMFLHQPNHLSLAGSKIWVLSSVDRGEGESPSLKSLPGSCGILILLPQGIWDKQHLRLIELDWHHSACFNRRG